VEGRLVSAPRLLAAAIGFTEGPIWTADSRLVVTSVSRGLIYEVALDGSAATVLTETGGGPNGLCVDAAGTIWVAQNAGATGVSKSERPVSAGLQTVSGEGDVADVLTEGCDAPNDLVEGPDGRIWFTDPPSPFDDRPGRVCAYDPQSGALEALLEGLEYPNGLAFGLGGDALYVAETRTARILRYDWDGEALGPVSVCATLSAGRPDGIAFDADGNLFVAATDSDSVAMFDGSGTEQPPIAFDGPTMPTNVAFAGPGLDVLVVTAGRGGRVFAVDGAGVGLALPGAAGR
jgi:gluconolactonase